MAEFDEFEYLKFFDSDAKFKWITRLVSYVMCTSVSIFMLIYFRVHGMFAMTKELGWDTAICISYAVYAIGLAFTVHFYIYGYCFQLYQPITSSRENQLCCVKDNIRAWVQEFEIRKKTERYEENCQRKCLVYQRDLACYMADPNRNPGLEYTRRDNLGLLVALTMWYVLGSSVAHFSISAGFYRAWNDWEEFCDYQTTPWGIFLVFKFVFGICMYSLQFWFPSYAIRGYPGRHGRGLRMRSLVRQIRKDCLVVDAEQGDGVAKERLKWWIENLLQVEEFGLDEKSDRGTKANVSDEENARPSTEEKIIDFLIERIRV